MTSRLEDRAVISGIGRSRCGRRINIPSLSLALEACLAAADDAGVPVRQIDGLVTWPGENSDPTGFGGPGVASLQQALRLDLSWYASGLEGFNLLGCLIDAMMAVATGLATHVLVCRTLTEATAQGSGRRAASIDGKGRVSGQFKTQVVAGLPAAANWAALYASRHFHEYGTTRDHLASLAIVQRANAGLNPSAIYRQPLTREEYFAARMISTPLCLFDCDVPADGAFAFIVSPAEQAADFRSQPIRVEAVGAARHGAAAWDQRPDMTTMAAHDAARQMWRRTSLTPGEVTFAELYDGFSFFTLSWLEALGLCGTGESGPFVGDGTRVALAGALPVNTGGGQLSEGRYVGFGLLYEACTQLRRQAGDRQVADTRVAAVGLGGGPVAQALLLRAS